MTAAGPFSWRNIALAAYGPTALASIGYGAVTPLVALSAIDRGATPGTAALITGLLGIGQLLADLPAGWVAERLGEKWSIVLACLIDVVMLGSVSFTHSLLHLAIATFVTGITGAVFGLARQTYLTVAIPLQYRARALSSLGGVFRVGGLVGPLIGAAVVATFGLPKAYLFAASMSLLAAIVTLTLPDLPSHTDSGGAGAGMFTVLRESLGVLLTQGVGALVIMLTRSARQAIIPLWCEAHGLSPAATSLVYSISMAFDVALFFFGGSLMDRFGRVWVAAPAMIVMGVGLAILPLTHHAATIIAVACLLGLGNGISSGVVMTLGSDASPTVGRTKFLAGWRLLSDSGNALGPLAIAAVATVSTLGAASVVLGVLAWGGAAWLLRWLPRRVPA
ncbi:MAG TPA: MFS transporter [Propionibacteriaceae bacterium]|nr:MFS transporter [Propionibacteriaceae bacterium]